MLALQLLVSGLATGSIYSLIALGVVLIYKCSGVVNFAQGAYAMMGAYLTFACIRLGVPAWIGVVLAMAAMAGIGVLTERLMLRPMLRAPLVAVMMATLGLLIFLRALCLAVWGPEQYAFPPLFPAEAVEIGSIFITVNYLAAAGLSLVLCLAFLAFYRYTPIGLLQRCTADNGRAALAIGIHVSQQISLAWAMSAALAALGGALLASLNGLSLELSNIGLVTFPVIVLGGLTSLLGAVLAGLLLGVLTAFTEGMLAPVLDDLLRAHAGIASVGALQQVVPYALLILMLMLRPQGLLGQRGTERI